MKNLEDVIDKADRRELRRNAPFILEAAHLLSGLPVVAICAAIIAACPNPDDVAELRDLLKRLDLDRRDDA